MAKAIIDMDYIKYAAAAASEKRTIEVYNESGQLIGDWKTRTEFKAVCKDNGLEYSDYTITDIQTPEPLANALHTAKMMTLRAIESSGCGEYKGFMGKGDSFRVERSTLLQYKGQRANTLKPVLLQQVEDYLIKTFDVELVYNLEADDRVVVECHKNDNIIIGLDKDYYGQGVRFLNVNRLDEGVLNCNCFGKLYRDEKGKVRGMGRIFLYFQIAFGDVSDNYRSNCMSDKPFGEVAAYNALKDATNDKEALTVLVAIYRHLYPEPKTVTGWRGDLIEIDFLYVLEENWMMAKMLKDISELDNPITCRSVLDKLGVDYE